MVENRQRGPLEEGEVLGTALGGDVPRTLRRRRPRQVAGDGRTDSGTELDGDGGAADRRSLRGHRPAAALSCSARSRVALLGTIVVGWIWARVVHHPDLRADARATQAIAEGRMDERVTIGGRDEIHQLGDSFNSMADRLVELQEDIRKQERQAMFGRIAAGLVHDLSHPIQNIGNSCKLIQDVRRSRVPRDVQAHGRARDGDGQARARRPAQHRAADPARAVPGRRSTARSPRRSSRCSSTPRPPASRCAPSCAPEPVFIEGDVFALGRVYRNLILNAIQATAPGGLIVVASRSARRSRADRVSRHRLRHPARAAGRDLRGLRHHQAARARPRAGDLQEDRRAARRPDPRRQRSRQGHDVRARFPRTRGPADARRRLSTRWPRKLFVGPARRKDMFRKLVKHRDRSRRAQLRRAVLRAADRAAAGATAARSCSAPRDRIIVDDDSMTSLESGSSGWRRRRSTAGCWRRPSVAA